MKVNWLNRCGEFCRADFGTPKDFLLKALLLSTLFLAAHLAGWREYTTFLSGTSAMPELTQGRVDRLTKHVSAAVEASKPTARDAKSRMGATRISNRAGIEILLFLIIFLHCCSSYCQQ